MFGDGDPKVETLRSLPLFSGLSRRSLARLAPLVDEIDVPAGRALIREGTIGREFFVLVDGEVVIERRDGTAAVLGPGDFFGEISLVARVPRSASAMAMRPSRLLVMTDRAFVHLARACPVVELRVLRAATRRLTGADDAALAAPAA